MKCNKTRRVLLFMSLLCATVSVAQTPFTSSNLPVIVIDTHGSAIVDDPKISADMGIIDNGPGVRNNLTDAHNNFDGKIGIEIRGSSSQMFPKKQYGIEVQDSTGAGIDASLLGMPKKDDWVLFAPYNDKSLMRDALAYKLGRDQGRYASRSRYCEVVINGVYMGVYVLLEKVKRDKNRVNIDKLEPTEISGDALTGGYLIKIDKPVGYGGEGWFSAFAPPGRLYSQLIYFLYDTPKQDDIADEQRAYIKDYVNAFENALAGDNFKDPAEGYAKYIDVDSFIDFFIMSEITKNVDAYRISTYLYKKKDSDGGKLYMGPIWDFNLGFGNVDYCTLGNPEGFVIYFNIICPDDYWLIPFWWNRLLEDDAFRAKLTARWTALREDKFKTTTILNYVDSVATVLNVESQQRNFAVWPVLGQHIWPNYYVGNTYQEEVTWLKNWITQRVAWLDENIPMVITGIQERTRGFSFQAYPNPFTQEIQLEYELNTSGVLHIDLFDILGRRIEHLEKNHDQLGKHQVNFSTSGWPAGSYIVKARFGNRVVNEKVVKKPE